MFAGAKLFDFLCHFHFCFHFQFVIEILAAFNEKLAAAGGLDVPMDRPFVVRDWRFGKYEVEGLQDPLSSFIRYMLEGAIFRKKKSKQQ